MVLMNQSQESLKLSRERDWDFIGRHDLNIFNYRYKSYLTTDYKSC